VLKTDESKACTRMMESLASSSSLVLSSRAIRG